MFARSHLPSYAGHRIQSEDYFSQRDHDEGMRRRVDHPERGRSGDVALVGLKECGDRSPGVPAEEDARRWREDRGFGEAECIAEEEPVEDYFINSINPLILSSTQHTFTLTTLTDTLP